MSSMTRKEAISRLEQGAPFSEVFDKSWEDALDMAISALFKEDDTEWIDNGADDFECHCKKCGQEIFKVQKWFKFCPTCGRRVIQK